MVAREAVEGFGLIGMVIADLGPHLQSFEHVGNTGRSDVHSESHRFVSGLAAVEGGIGEAASEVGEVEIGGEGGGEEALIVAPRPRRALAAVAADGVGYWPKVTSMPPST